MRSLLRSNWRLLAFYVGVPFFVAVYGALNNWEIQQAAGYLVAIAFYLSHSFVPWWITCLSSSSLMWLFRRWRPAPLLIMIPGSILGCIFTLPYTYWITGVFDSIWPTSVTSLTGIPGHPWSGDFVEYLLRATVVWIAVNFLFDRFLGLPRYRYEIPRGYEDKRQTLPDNQPIQLPFLARLPVQIEIDDVLAIKAEQHYIRIFTPRKDFMVLYRFSDAVALLDSDKGLQIHRSWWVAKNAIDSMQQAGKKLYIVLKNGEQAPVSTPYQGLIKEMARSMGLTIRPAPQNPAA